MGLAFRSVFAFLFFILIMLWIIVILFFAPFIIIDEIATVITTGFAVQNSQWALLGVASLFIWLSLVVPVFRPMYYRLPWLFAFVKIFLLNYLILSVALAIINFGYEVQNPGRHILFLFLMILQIVLCRLAMSF